MILLILWFSASDSFSTSLALYKFIYLLTYLLTDCLLIWDSVGGGNDNDNDNDAVIRLHL